MENTCQSCLTIFPELKVITSELKCGICYEFIKTPMSTLCGHSYCSICIRTWITTKQLCPTCQTEVRDESLRNNRTLENSIAPYISLQSKLHEFCKTGIFKNLKPSAKSTQEAPKPKDSVSGTKHHNGDTSTESNHINEMKQLPRLPSTPEHNKAVAKRDNVPQIVQSPAKIPAVFLTSPKSQNQQKPKTFTSPTSTISSRVQNDFGGSSSTQNANITKVPCPVCFVEIPGRNINIHLDNCLKTGDTAASPSPRKPENARREPLKKMVYHMMSEKEIRKKLQEFGLSTKGSRTQLVNRLQRYTVLYNSECDSLHPRSLAEIRREVEKDEEALNKVSTSTTKMNRIPKYADPSQMEEINKQYRSEHKSEFENLIREVREREKRKKSVPADESSSSNRTTARKSEDDEVPLVGTALKRYRISDDDSDEFSSLKRKAPSSKSRKLDDSDDDIFLPNSEEIPIESSAPAGKVKKKTTEKRTKGEENQAEKNGNGSDAPMSPVLIRSPNENSKKMKSRLRRQRPQSNIEISPIEDDRPKRGRKGEEQRGRTNERAQLVKRVSRTPSLSPSQLEDLAEDKSGNSETPEMIFETSRRASQDSDSDERDDGNNLSRFLDLIQENGDCSD